MGRINIKYILKGIRYNLIKLIPYKLRRPFILYFSILGLIGYYHFMINISSHLFGKQNEYLLIVGNSIKYCYEKINEFANKELIVLLVIVIIFWTTYKYCIKDEYQDIDNNRSETKDKKIERRSWYYSINTIISLGYALITVLAIIPIIGG